MKDLQIGGSFRYGVRDDKFVNYDYPGMSTQGNFGFWSPVYTSSKGRTHVIPAGVQMAFAGELRVPIDIVDLTGEFVYVKNETREAVESFQSTNSERFGDLKGFAYYVQLAVWPMGGREILGNPGYQNPSHVDLKKPDAPTLKTAVQIVAKWEQLNAKYESASRAGTKDATNNDGSIKVNAFSLGINYWATKHVRLSANYVLNMFPSSAPVSPVSASVAKQGEDQRAVAPANLLPKCAPGATVPCNDDARDNAHVLHEVLFRAAVAF